jgi:formate dehydrogenase
MRKVKPPNNMAKILSVLGPDPVSGYPTSYARDDIPKITSYPEGQSVPTPDAAREGS